MSVEFTNRIEKENGTNRFICSICHHTLAKPENIRTTKGNVVTDEYFVVHYSWKTEKRSLFNITMGATLMLEESLKIQAKKVVELEKKIGIA